MKKDRHGQKGSLKGEVMFVLVKTIIFMIVCLFVSVFVFGMLRCPDDSMSPSFQGGDLVLFNRLDREYRASDVVVVKTPKGLQVRRIVAVARDKVEIDGEGLKINGHLQSESRIYEKTFPSKKGISFPVRVKRGSVFVLADERQNSVDSRIYGAVSERDIKGTVVSVFRVRGF